MKSFICILFTFITALAACTGQHRRVDTVLTSADSLVFAAPDSAVRLLDSLTLDRASSDQLDRHALLTAKAREKAGIIARDDTPDSMLSRSIDALGVAADHFRGRGDSLEVQTLFYRGVLLGYRGDYSEALVSLMEAADRAAETGDNFYRAMSYREQADIYSQFYSIAESYKNAKLAIDHFELAAKPLHALHEKIMVAKYLVMLNEPDKALKNLAVIRSDSLLSNKAFLALYHRVISEALSAKKDYQSALSHVDSTKIYAGHLSSIQLSEKSRLLSGIGRTKEAEKVLEEAESCAETQNDTANLFYSQSKIFVAQCQYEKAYKAFMKYNSGLTITTNHLISHPYTTLLTDYYYNSNAENLLKRKSAEENVLSEISAAKTVRESTVPIALTEIVFYHIFRIFEANLVKYSAMRVYY